ncbi:hypothetical protein ASZ90_000649 [hydrocarbon metagenome]|uniref:Uncharacterized protein n=1 Tax=hydrocarbon metagenome TaxID=938273 RepID=A0A0W8G8N1_9ZZZZ
MRGSFFFRIFFPCQREIGEYPGKVVKRDWNPGEISCTGTRAHVAIKP